jgi:hypothetical protein
VKVLDLDNYLEILARKPCALPGATVAGSPDLAGVWFAIGHASEVPANRMQAAWLHATGTGKTTVSHGEAVAGKGARMPDVATVPEIFVEDVSQESWEEVVASLTHDDTEGGPILDTCGGTCCGSECDTGL